MTLGELRSELARYLGLDSTTSDGLVAFWDTQLLNDAMRQIEVELNLPRLSIVVDKATLEADPEVSLPDASSVLQIVAAPDRIIPILAEEDWAPSSEDRPLVAYYDYGAICKDGDPVKVLFLKGESWEWPESVRIVYQGKHVPLVNETDQPWGGRYARYHGLIAMRAAMDGLLRLDPGEPETRLRYTSVAASYQSMKERLVEELDHNVSLMSNPMGVGVYWRRSRWS